MAEQEIVKQTFIGGEQSEKMFGRWDLSIFNSGCRRLKNFTLQTQGPAEYRNGFRFVFHSRLNQILNLQTFEFNDEQAYALEFTNKKLRFYRNNGIIQEANVTITGITKANPGVVTATAHGYSDGDEVFINSVVGMTEVNGKAFIVANKAANTFELTDVDSNNVDTSGFTTYSSGGVANKIVEIDTPYTEANDLFKIKKDHVSDTMYITHPLYLPRELTRTSDTSWTLTLQTRTSDPLTDKKVITNITQANPGVVTSSSHGYSDGDIVVIEEVVGMVEVNSQPYIVANKIANTFELTDLAGNNVDTSGFTAYSSVGFASNQNLIPDAVALYESRLWYGGPKVEPAQLFSSRAPDVNGNPRYTDFTTGANADDGVRFVINEGSGKIFWLAGTDRLLLAGTFGGIIKVTGADDELAITPTSIKARALDRIGAEDIAPINKESFIQYVQKNGRTIKTLQFEALKDNYVPTDENLISDEITATGGSWARAAADSENPGLKQITWQTGRPDVLWNVKKDGVLLGLTFKPEESVSGWHRHTTGATGEDKFLTATTVPRPTNYDQLWAGTELTIDGSTRRYVGYQADTPVFPKAVDYFTGVNNETADTEVFERALLESQKAYIHLDQSLTYDGTTAGVAASASVTPGATTGASVTFTAGAAVFVSSDVGREIWKRSINGVGTGRAEITAFTNTTTVTCKILNGADFDNTDAMPAGDWYLTTNSLSNIDHLEGRVIGVVADGGVHPDRTVANGAISLAFQASVIHIGLKYEGFLQPMSMEFGGETGPSVTKLKNIREFGFRFSNTLGASFGTDLYNEELIQFTTMPINVGQPQFLFSGVKRQPYQDNWENDKIAYVRQNNPLPCIVQQMVFYGDTEES